MSAAPILNSFGGDLTRADYDALAARWITPGLADAAGLRRVDSPTAQEMFGRKRGELAGIIIPYTTPGQPSAREYRLRRDTPDLEIGIDGLTTERAKYISVPGRGSLVYFPPESTQALLESSTVPVIVTEGEFKTLALWRLARENSTGPRFLPIGLSGVWNFRGTVGKTTGPNGDRRDVKGIITDFDRITWKSRRVIIAYDADAEKNPKVRAARWQLTSALVDRGALVGNLEWPITEGKGIDDRLAKIGAERVLSDIAAVEFGDWRTKLLRNEAGKLLPCYENAALLLENSSEWRGVLGYNEFTAGHVLLAAPPTPVTAGIGDEIEDHFDIEVTRWLERRGLMVKPDLSRRVADGIARQRSYHPVRDYLVSLPPWDEKPRIGKWLFAYCGVESCSEDHPNHYAEAVGAKFLISAVARIMQPGCKADHLLILEGPQGIGKSTVVRILAGDEWFSDQLADMGSKDSSMQLRGVWIVELSELDVLNRAELARAKAFLSAQSERFRLPYGRRVIQAPRQCVFIGTTNSDTWLKDETGGRRFWPVRCRAIDLARLHADRDQLWAEALFQYRAGASWWLDDPELVRDAIDQQRERYDADPWQGLVQKWLGGQHDVSIDDVLTQCLEKPKGQWTQADKNRVGRCLRALGWDRYRVRDGAALAWRFREGDGR